MAFKDYKSRSNWYRNPAEIDLEIRKRILPTKSGASPLRNFDGSTHFSYQMPQKPYEIVYCRTANNHEECAKYSGFSPDHSHISISQVEENSVSSGASQGVGIGGSNGLPQNTSIASGRQTRILLTGPTTWSLMKKLELRAMEGDADEIKNIGQLINYLEGYGICNTFLVSCELILFKLSYFLYYDWTLTSFYWPNT